MASSCEFDLVWMEAVGWFSTGSGLDRNLVEVRVGLSALGWPFGTPSYFFVFIAEGSQVVTCTTRSPLRVSNASDPR